MMHTSHHLQIVMTRLHCHRRDRMGAENQGAKRHDLGVEYEPFSSAAPVHNIAGVDAVNDYG
jgi:hypothetical protein